MTYEEIAQAYDVAPSIPTARARRAYRLLAAYVDARFFGSIPETGWKIVPVYADAIPDPQECIRTKTLPTYDLAHGHPCLSDAENFRFRAVHDLFGHDWLGAAPLGFGVDNEQDAACRQVADFSRWYGLESAGIWPGWDGEAYSTFPDACAALVGEIFGQAAYYEARGRFPEQKAFLLSTSVLEKR